MALFGLFSKPAFDEGAEEFRKTPGARLIDVRSAEEYAGGHLAESENVPLDQIAGVAALAADKSTPLFVYCYSGARSAQAVSLLKRMGYTNVKNIGGIKDYHGGIVR